MTTYTAITNALVAVGAKPFATTIQALRDNPIAIAEGDSTVPANLRNTVLLGTLTTTSGTTQTLSGLVLTPFRSLFCVIDGVSFTTTVTLTVDSLVCTAALSTSGSTFLGHLNIDLATGIFVCTSNNGFAGGSSSSYTSKTSYRNASTSISFGGGTFDAGSIRIYGVK